MKYKIRRIVCLLIILSFSLGITTVTEEPIECNLDNIPIIVKNGDTIWNLVETHYDEINKPFFADIRYVVDYVSEYNNGCNLEVGQTVLIPKDIK